MSAIAYRPDIDGLRAVAVGIVVLFHAGLGLFPGGFIGVDVFFVISGYLITSIIVRELDAGAFSLLSFYERRIRRIFPALLVVIAACLVVAAFCMTPRDYENVSESALAAIGFHSNFYFASDAGYFMPMAETIPLLHTWSLGVEEQFYVVAPLLLVAMWWRRAWIAPVFGLLFVGALFVSLWGLARNSDTAFYLPHTRAVELMIGVGLGLGLVPEIRSRILRQTLSLIGLVLIVGSASLYTNATPFPGAAALVPCLGSALIIHCAGGPSGVSLVGRLLSTSPSVWLGKISYSLYLWHWPIFAFAAYEWGDLHIAARIAIVAISIALAALTYYWIEQPVRRSRTLLTPARVFATGLGTAGMLAVAATAIKASDGWPTRLSPEAMALAVEISQRGSTPNDCWKKQRAKTTQPCFAGAPANAPTILLWGDSHAYALSPAVDAVAKEIGAGVIILSRPGCPPLLDAGTRVGAGEKRCQASAKLFSELLETKSVRHVIMTARWASYAGRPHDEKAYRAFNDRETADLEGQRVAFSGSVKRTVEHIRQRNIRVTLVGPVPELPVHLPTAVLKALMRDEAFELEYDFAHFRNRQHLVHRTLGATEHLTLVDVIYPDRVLCPLGKCEFVENGFPLYTDSDHLSPRGALSLSSNLAQSLAWLDRAGAQPRNDTKQEPPALATGTVR